MSGNCWSLAKTNTIWSLKSLKSRNFCAATHKCFLLPHRHSCEARLPSRLPQISSLRRPDVIQALHLPPGLENRRRRDRHVDLVLRHVPHPGRTRVLHQALRALAAALRVEQNLPQLAAARQAGATVHRHALVKFLSIFFSGWLSAHCLEFPGLEQS